MNCRKCKLDIKWVRIKRRWYCQNLDGSDHWDTCSQRMFDRLKSEGRYFHEKQGKEFVKGYEHQEFGKKAYERSGTFTIGKGYKPIHHAQGCSVLPWEDCQCHLRSP